MAAIGYWLFADGSFAVEKRAAVSKPIAQKVRAFKQARLMISNPTYRI